MRDPAVLAHVAVPSPGDRRDPAAWVPWLRRAFADRPQRFHHSLTVFERARRRAHRLPATAVEQLVLAALLHDVGRALDPRNTRPHGFVGADFLDEMGLHDVAPLVAHHSGARFEAAARGFADQDRWRDRDEDLLAALTYLDRTTGPTGDVVTLAERRADLCRRRGADSLSVVIFDLVLPEARYGRSVLAAPALR